MNTVVTSCSEARVLDTTYFPEADQCVALVAVGASEDSHGPARRQVKEWFCERFCMGSKANGADHTTFLMVKAAALLRLEALGSYLQTEVYEKQKLGRSLGTLGENWRTTTRECPNGCLLEGRPGCRIDRLGMLCHSKGSSCASSHEMTLNNMHKKVEDDPLGRDFLLWVEKLYSEIPGPGLKRGISLTEDAVERLLGHLLVMLGIALDPFFTATMQSLFTDFRRTGNDNTNNTIGKKKTAATNNVGTEKSAEDEVARTSEEVSPGNAVDVLELCANSNEGWSVVQVVQHEGDGKNRKAALRRRCKNAPVKKLERMMQKVDADYQTEMVPRTACNLDVIRCGITASSPEELANDLCRLTPARMGPASASIRKIAADGNEHQVNDSSATTSRPEEAQKNKSPTQRVLGRVYEEITGETEIASLQEQIDRSGKSQMKKVWNGGTQSRSVTASCADVSRCPAPGQNNKVIQTGLLDRQIISAKQANEHVRRSSTLVDPIGALVNSVIAEKMQAKALGAKERINSISKVEEGGRSAPEITATRDALVKSYKEADSVDKIVAAAQQLMMRKNAVRPRPKSGIPQVNSASRSSTSQTGIVLKSIKPHGEARACEGAIKTDDHVHCSERKIVTPVRPGTTRSKTESVEQTRIKRISRPKSGRLFQENVKRATTNKPACAAIISPSRIGENEVVPDKLTPEDTTLSAPAPRLHDSLTSTSSRETCRAGVRSGLLACEAGAKKPLAEPPKKVSYFRVREGIVPVDELLELLKTKNGWVDDAAHLQSRAEKYHYASLMLIFVYRPQVFVLANETTTSSSVGHEHVTTAKELRPLTFGDLASVAENIWLAYTAKQDTWNKTLSSHVLNYLRSAEIAKKEVSFGSSEVQLQYEPYVTYGRLKTHLHYKFARASDASALVDDFSVGSKHVDHQLTRKFAEDRDAYHEQAKRCWTVGKLEVAGARSCEVVGGHGVGPGGVPAHQKGEAIATGQSQCDSSPVKGGEFVFGIDLSRFHQETNCSSGVGPICISEATSCASQNSENAGCASVSDCATDGGKSALSDAKKSGETTTRKTSHKNNYHIKRPKSGPSSCSSSRRPGATAKEISKLPGQALPDEANKAGTLLPQPSPKQAQEPSDTSFSRITGCEGADAEDGKQKRTSATFTGSNFTVVCWSQLLPHARKQVRQACQDYTNRATMIEDIVHKSTKGAGSVVHFESLLKKLREFKGKLVDFVPTPNTDSSRTNTVAEDALIPDFQALSTQFESLREEMAEVVNRLSREMAEVMSQRQADSKKKLTQDQRKRLASIQEDD